MVSQNMDSFLVLKTSLFAASLMSNISVQPCNILYLLKLTLHTYG